MTATTPRVVVAYSRRGSGVQFGRAPTRPSTLSDYAQGLGLFTRDDVEREHRAELAGWTLGRRFHCPFCDIEIHSASAAQKHQRNHGCIVLRVDWDRP